MKLQFPLKSLAESQEEQLKLPSLLEPEEARQAPCLPMAICCLLAEFPQIALQEVKRDFRKYSKDELLKLCIAAWQWI